jgi:hypothetical protein
MIIPMRGLPRKLLFVVKRKRTRPAGVRRHLSVGYLGGIAHWECLFEQGGLLVTTFFQPAGSLLERFLGRRRSLARQRGR